jgi:hypothetical protein
MDVDLLDIDTAIEASFPEEPPEGDDKNQPAEPGNDDAEDDEAGKPAAKPAKKEGEDGEDEDGEEKPAEGDEKDDQKPVDKPKKSRAAERIESLARERSQLRRELEDLRKQIDSRPPELPPQPNPEDYKTERDYAYAMGQYNATVEGIKAEHGKADERRIEREKATYQDKITKDKARFADFDKVVSSLGDTLITPELHDALYGCDNPADILYFLGKNPLIADQVLSMSGRQQTIKLAEISVKLAAAQKPKNIKSAAPKPPDKPKGSGAATAGGYSENMSFEDHCKYMRKLEAQRRKARYG